MTSQRPCHQNTKSDTCTTRERACVLDVQHDKHHTGCAHASATARHTHMVSRCFMCHSATRHKQAPQPCLCRSRWRHLFQLPRSELGRGGARHDPKVGAIPRTGCFGGVPHAVNQLNWSALPFLTRFYFSVRRSSTTVVLTRYASYYYFFLQARPSQLMIVDRRRNLCADHDAEDKVAARDSTKVYSPFRPR